MTKEVYELENLYGNLTFSERLSLAVLRVMYILAALIVCKFDIDLSFSLTSYTCHCKFDIDL